MATFLNELHPWKASCAMLVTDAGTATLANELQKAKAFCSMLVTDAGMSTLANEPHPRKAPSSMLVTDVGMSTVVSHVLLTFHCHHDSRVILLVPSGTIKCNPSAVTATVNSFTSHSSIVGK